MVGDGKRRAGYRERPHQRERALEFHGVAAPDGAEQQGDVGHHPQRHPGGVHDPDGKEDEREQREDREHEPEVGRADQRFLPERNHAVGGKRPEHREHGQGVNGARRAQPPHQQAAAQTQRHAERPQESDLEQRAGHGIREDRRVRQSGHRIRQAAEEQSQGGRARVVRAPGVEKGALRLPVADGRRQRMDARTRHASSERLHGRSSVRPSCCMLI